MSAAWPGDSATVERWARSALRRAAVDDEIEVQGVDGIRVTADPDGLDLRELTADATGADLRVKVRRDASGTAGPATEPAEEGRENGVARSVRFAALPMRLQRIPVTADVRVEDLPIAWITYAGPAVPGVPESGYALEPDEGLGGARGTFRFAIAAEDAGPLITAVLRPLLREGGVRLGRVRVEVAGGEGDDIRISASAGVRWKLLHASARAGATIAVSPEGVVTLRELSLSSRNPAVKAVLLVARRHVQGYVGRTVDPSTAFSDGSSRVGFQDVRIGTGDELSIAGRFSAHPAAPSPQKATFTSSPPVVGLRERLVRAPGILVGKRRQ